MNSIESDGKNKNTILECEKQWVYAALIMVGGYLGAFTYSVRGGVFCNAQTANVVLFSMSIGNGNWEKALYYLIPISAYLLGAVISEWLPHSVKKLHLVRWDTILVGIEALVIFLIGWIPDSVPFQVSQVAINFICSMQYNTFRQAEHIPMATTFCTNHIRQLGVGLTGIIRHPHDKKIRSRFLAHLLMLSSFIAGCIISALLCSFLGGKAVWGASLLMTAVFVRLAYVDLTTERELIDIKPSGH